MINPRLSENWTIFVFSFGYFWVFLVIIFFWLKLGYFWVFYHCCLGIFQLCRRAYRGQEAVCNPEIITFRKKKPTAPIKIELIVSNIFLSQLYSSTTVVMATHGLHWKWQSLTPCQRHLSKPIEKIFGTIDYVIDLNNLANLVSENFLGTAIHMPNI